MSGKRRFQSFPRKIIKQPPSWRATIIVLGNGNGFKGFSHDIYFSAFHGGEAKTKALPKIKHFLDVSLWGCQENVQIKVLLEKMPINGNGNGGVPSYVLRKKYSYFSSIMAVKRPSQAFKINNTRR